MKGHLNLFQAAMLRWRDLHPYSAVHAVRIDVPLDPARLETVIDGQLTALGLKGLTLDAKRAAFEYLGGDAPVGLKVQEGGERPLEVLQREVERELNLPFPREGRLVPFRFVAVTANPGFYLVLTYDHFVAAGDSIVVLMKRMHDAYRGTESTPARPLLTYPDTCGRLFRRHAGALVLGFRRLHAMISSCRRSVRPRYGVETDLSNGFVYRRIEPAEFSALVRTAKAWGVTLNDLLMAIILEVLDPFAGKRPEGQRRRELGVASIVNLRRDFGYDVNATFGQFLSSFRVAHPLPPGIPLRDVARDIHTETARIKGEKLYLQNLLASGGLGTFWRFLTPRRRGLFYAKHYPAWAAITTVGVDALWAGAGASASPPEYLRAVSTGPLAPLVVAVTTNAGVLHAGMSYRTTAFARADMDRIATTLIDNIRALAT